MHMVAAVGQQWEGPLYKMNDYKILLSPLVLMGVVV